MKTNGLGAYLSLETALKEMGFKMNDVEKKGKKTVISVSHSEKAGELRACSAFKTVPPVSPNIRLEKGDNFNG